MATDSPRFGVWALTPGTWGSFHHPEEPVDASWDRIKQQILLAETLGYDASLLAQHTLHPMGPAYEHHDAWTGAAALAALTSRIEIITAIKPALYHPVILAKQALGIEDISHGRFSINVVNAWFTPELETTGIGLRSHDERYAYGDEWLSVTRSLFEDDTTTFDGEHFHVHGVSLKPRSRTRKRPLIYVGGESEPARRLAAHHADAFIMNGRPLHDIQAFIADMRARPRGDAPPLSFALAAFVIARETAEEAQAEFERAWQFKRADQEEFSGLINNVAPNAVMFKTFADHPHVGTNGGTAAGLVGSYDQVADRIRAFHAIGIDLFMLQFQPFEAEMERFAREIFPRVRNIAIAGAA